MLPPHLPLPPQIPVMVLPNCNLLPQGLLPLCIFEPRYRQMLADALESDRLFAIGTVEPESELDDKDPEVCEFSCAGMVRACVGADDGTSHLVLQGLQRLRFTGWINDRKPYRIATIEPVPSTDENSQASATLAKRALDLAHELISAGHPAPAPQAIAELESLSDPEQLADAIAYHLIRDPHRRQSLLGMQDVGERLRFVIEELANIGPSLP